MTLLYLLSLFYWTIDYGFTNYNSGFAILLLTTALLLSAFSVLNALTYIRLSGPVRLILSIWSTVIRAAFAIDNIVSVFGNADIESSYLADGLYIGLQYFLLGVSTVYIMQNFIMLMALSPDKNRHYGEVFKEAKRDHIERYSAEQVYVGHSVSCILFTVIVYGLNYRYRVLPRHTMIWLTFLIFPLILQLANLLSKQRKYN